MFSRKESLKQHVSYKHSRNEVRGARALVLVVEVQRAIGRETGSPGRGRRGSGVGGGTGGAGRGPWAGVRPAVPERGFFQGNWTARIRACSCS